MKVLQPQMMKNGGSMLTLAPKRPNMPLATAIRLAVRDAKVLSSGMLLSLNNSSFRRILSLNSRSSGALDVAKLKSRLIPVSTKQSTYVYLLHTTYHFLKLFTPRKRNLAC